MNPMGLLIGGLAFTLTPIHAVRAASASVAGGSSPSTGTITGQVSNAAAQSYLQGAAVELVGANQSATTDRDGRYQFNRVPNGAATLAVSYPGLDSQQISVEVSAGQTVVRDVALSSEYYRLEAFNVTEAREGSARAIVEQKNASNIKSVVATDAFGNLRDGNVAELLSRLPGLSVLYSSNDIRTVMVRGIDSSLGLTTIDGNQLANAESAQMSRSFQWDQSSVDQIETVEVERTPTPDKDAAA
ncbi:MAG: carboxypeptidase regulatory-like domain-containing protein, partial [Opitutaceae bacterium]